MRKSSYQRRVFLRIPGSEGAKKSIDASVTAYKSKPPVAPWIRLRREKPSSRRTRAGHPLASSEASPWASSWEASVELPSQTEVPVAVGSRGARADEDYGKTPPLSGIVDRNLIKYLPRSAATNCLVCGGLHPLTDRRYLDDPHNGHRPIFGVDVRRQSAI